MPVPRPQSRHPAGLSRRQLIIVASAVPLVWFTGGCTLSGPGRDEPTSSAQQAEADPDVAILASAAAQVDDLVALCEQVIDQRPSVTRQLQPLLETHRRHAEVLGSAAAGRQGSPSGTPTSSAPAGPLPRGRRAVLSLVGAAEQRAAKTHMGQVREAESGQFAQLLASISAAESQLATVLEEEAR